MATTVNVIVVILENSNKIHEFVLVNGFMVIDLLVENQKKKEEQNNFVMNLP